MKQPTVGSVAHFPLTARRGVGARLFAGAMIGAVALLSAVPASAQVTERLRSAFARAETSFRTAEPDLAIQPLTVVIGALLPEAQVGGLDDEARALLVRSLAYRADARLFNGERSAADEDLDLLLNLYPRVGIEGFALSEGVLERFDRAQSRLLGTLMFTPTSALWGPP